MPEVYAEVELRILNETQASLHFNRGDSQCSGKPRLGAETTTALLGLLDDTDGYGRLLFERVLPAGESLESCFRERIAAARDARQRVRLRVMVDPEAPTILQDLRWEWLSDPREMLAYGRSREIVVSRFAAVTRPLTRTTVTQPKVLVVVAMPSDAAKYRLASPSRADMVQELRAAFQDLEGALACEVLEGPATFRRIYDKVAEGFHILHIVAHGQIDGARNDAYIVLEAEDGTAQFVNEKDFCDIAEGLDTLQLITLMCCNSGVSTRDDPFRGLAGPLVRRGTPAVIGMTRPISIAAAGVFSKTFYPRLAASGIVDAALNSARWHLYREFDDTPDWSAPALYMRAPDGVLWNPPAQIQNIPIDQADNVLSRIRDALDEGKLVPVIGPALNQHLLPSGAEVTRLWAGTLPPRSYRYVLEGRNDLPRVAKLMQIKGKYPQDELHTLYRRHFAQKHGLKDENFKGLTLTDVAKTVPLTPSPDEDEPHMLLAKMRAKVYLTTNYDPFMSIALSRTVMDGKPREPRREYCRWDEKANPPKQYNISGTLEKPLVFHLFGDDRSVSSMVLTEDDYLDYVRNVSWQEDKESWRIPSQLRLHLTESLLLFLGFRAFDLSFRVMFKAVILNLGRQHRGRYAVLQIDPGESPEQERMELQQFLKDDLLSNWQVTVLWMSVPDLLSRLVPVPVEAVT